MPPGATADCTRASMFTPLHRICMVGFSLDFAAMAAMTAVPFFVFKQLGGGAEMSGMFGAAQGALYTVVCLASAGIVQRARNGLDWAVAGLVAFAVFLCIGPFFRSPIVCGTLFAVGIASMALAWPALHSWVGAHPDPRQRARRMSWFNVSWSFGFAISPLFAGPLYDVDYRLPFALVLGLTVLAILLVRSLPNDRHMHTADEAPDEADPASVRRSEAHLMAGMCGLIVGSGLAGVTRTVFPKRIDELVATGQLRLLWEASPLPILTNAPATKYSWLAFGLSLASAGMILVLGRTKRWQHSFAIPVGMQALAAICFWTLARTQSLLVMLACFAVVGANIGLAFFASIFYCVANPASKHRRAAINEGAVGAGGLLGNLYFGYFVERCGHAATFQWTPAVVAAAIAIQAGLLWIGRRRFLAPGD